MINFFKNALKKIGTGLLYGIGFGVAAGVIMFVITDKMTASMWSDEGIEKVKFTKHEEVKRGTSVYILGTIENSASVPIRSLTIQVDLLDKNGKFVEQCSEYIRGTFKAGESRNFKVSCGGCKDKPVVEHESYKLRAVGI
jgi:hypothetical protein